MTDFKNDISKALEVLRSGGVILYPTDTIWGLGCDATNPEAVKKIYTLKKRTDNKTMIILVDTPNRINSYIEEVPDIAFDLMELTNKPLTLILEGAKNLAENVVNREDQSVGIRVVNEAFCQQLIRQFKKPIVSTSANYSGEAAPAIFDEIDDTLISQVDFVVEYRQDDIKKTTPSGIIKVETNGGIKIIRA